ncbi:MAG: hypothetical protein ABIJ28_03970 [Patescibacteria group bacterium]
MSTQPQTCIIPRNIANKDDLVVIPRGIYNEFLNCKKFAEKRLSEEKEADEAIRIYKQEKKAGKLKTASSFSEILKEAKRYG